MLSFDRTISTQSATQEDSRHKFMSEGGDFIYHISIIDYL